MLIAVLSQYACHVCSWQQMLSHPLRCGLRRCRLRCSGAEIRDGGNGVVRQRRRRARRQRLQVAACQCIRMQRRRHLEALLHWPHRVQSTAPDGWKLRRCRWVSQVALTGCLKHMRLRCALDLHGVGICLRQQRRLAVLQARDAQSGMLKVI